MPKCLYVGSQYVLAIRFGWDLCGNDGYAYHLKIYQGKELTATAQQELLEKRVINIMVGIITENYDVLNHKLCVDKFFSSYKLMCGLAEKDVAPQEKYERIEQEDRIKNLFDPKNSKRRSKEILIIAPTVKFLWLNDMTTPW